MVQRTRFIVFLFFFSTLLYKAITHQSISQKWLLLVCVWVNNSVRPN